jgi:hypothetical protein
MRIAAPDTPSPAPCMEIPGDCDAASASALVPILRERIAATNGPVRLDLTDAQPTAFALQLLRRACHRRPFAQGLRNPDAENRPDRR